MTKEMWLDRAASGELVDALRPDGPLHALKRFRDEHQDLVDLQFRRPSARGSRRSWITVYAGLTRALDVVAHGGESPQFSLEVSHATHRAAKELEHIVGWNERGTLAAIEARIEGEVLPYLEGRLTWLAGPGGSRHAKEGRTHASMCSDAVTSFRVINREAAPAFADVDTRDELVDPIHRTIERALDKGVPGKPWVKNARRFGTSPDILAIDRVGRILVAEAKPAGSAGITRGPVQALFYAALIALWYQQDPDAAASLDSMLQQRVRAGLSARWRASSTEATAIVPVLAVGPAVRDGDVIAPSAQALKNAGAYRSALEPATEALRQLFPMLAPIEIWRLSVHGDIEDRV